MGLKILIVCSLAIAYFFYRPPAESAEAAERGGSRIKPEDSKAQIIPTQRGWSSTSMIRYSAHVIVKLAAIAYKQICRSKLPQVTFACLKFLFVNADSNTRDLL